MNLYDVQKNKLDDDSIHRFLDEYETIYYYEVGISAEKEIEDILMNGIGGQEDVFKILAWKIGGVDRNLSNANGKLQWKDSWSWKDRVGKYRGGEINLKDFLKRFEGKDLQELKKLAVDNAEEALSKLAEGAPNGIGPVYLITLLYFLNQGRNYPIYDKYAHAALKAILSDKESRLGDAVIDRSIMREYPLKRDSDFGKKIMKENEKYREYMKLIDTFTKESGISYYATEKESNRKADRALWAYGHLFREAK